MFSKRGVAQELHVDSAQPSQQVLLLSRALGLEELAVAEPVQIDEEPACCWEGGGDG